MAICQMLHKPQLRFDILQDSRSVFMLFEKWICDFWKTFGKISEKNGLQFGIWHDLLWEKTGDGVARLFNDTGNLDMVEA